MRNLKRKQTQLRIAQDSLATTEVQLSKAKENFDVPNPNELQAQVIQFGFQAKILKISEHCEKVNFEFIVMTPYL